MNTQTNDMIDFIAHHSIMTPILNHSGDMVGKKYDFMPGNGLRYTIAIFHIQGEFGLGTLGHVTDGAIIVNGFNGRSYLFTPGGYYTHSYVGDKLLKDSTPDGIDEHCITALVTYALNGTSNASMEKMDIRV